MLAIVKPGFMFIETEACIDLEEGIESMESMVVDVDDNGDGVFIGDGYEWAAEWLDFDENKIMFEGYIAESYDF
jgi:hypothetical protein